MSQRWENRGPIFPVVMVNLATYADPLREGDALSTVGVAEIAEHSHRL